VSYMKVVRPSEAPSEEMTGCIFTGTIKMAPLLYAAAPSWQVIPLAILLPGRR